MCILSPATGCLRTRCAPHPDPFPSLVPYSREPCRVVQAPPRGGPAGRFCLPPGGPCGACSRLSGLAMMIEARTSGLGGGSAGLAVAHRGAIRSGSQGGRRNSTRRRAFYGAVGSGLTGAALLMVLYFAIVSLAEGPEHAVDLFWEDRWIVIPIILGFGVQASLYTILKKRLYLPVLSTGASGPLMGAGGTTSTVAMVACCAHHVTAVLPIVGLTAASAFLAEYRTIFMLVGLGTTLTGIAVMLTILLRERSRALQLAPAMLGARCPGAAARSSPA